MCALPCWHRRLAWLVNWLRTRTDDHWSVPKGRLLSELSPGEKFSDDTYWRLSLMSNTQCAAVTTCFGPISVPVHSRPLHA